jgi:hypothetical protein
LRSQERKSYQVVTPDGTISAPVSATISDDQLDRMAQAIAQAVTPAQSTEQQHQQYQQEEVPEFNTSAELAAYVKSQIAQEVAVARQEMQSQIAPTLIQSGKMTATQGLSELQRQCFDEALNDVPAHLRASVVNDPMTAKLMRSAAIGMAVEKAGGHIPSSNDPAARTSRDSMDSRDKASVEDLMASIPGMTEKRAKDLVLNARKAVSK